MPPQTGPNSFVFAESARIGGRRLPLSSEREILDPPPGSMVYFEVVAIITSLNVVSFNSLKRKLYISLSCRPQLNQICENPMGTDVSENMSAEITNYQRPTARSFW